MTNSNPIPRAPQFECGHIIMSPLVYQLAQAGQLHVLSYLDRHRAGDWGEVNDQERQANDRALSDCGAVFSIYSITPILKLVIWTEKDRKETTLLLGGCLDRFSTRASSQATPTGP
jgi:hypothetical protein